MGSNKKNTPDTKVTTKILTFDVYNYGVHTTTTRRLKLIEEEVEKNPYGKQPQKVKFIEKAPQNYKKVCVRCKCVKIFHFIIKTIKKRKF